MKIAVRAEFIERGYVDVRGRIFDVWCDGLKIRSAVAADTALGEVHYLCEGPDGPVLEGVGVRLGEGPDGLVLEGVDVRLGVIRGRVTIRERTG